MNANRTLIAVLAAAAVLLIRFSSPGAAHEATSSAMSDAAGHLLASLTADQRAKAALAFEGEERLDFHFIPKARKGLTFKEMTPSQRHLAHAFLSTGLSSRGYVKATTIMSLEEVLRELEGGGRIVRDPEVYYFTIFGDPSGAAPWGWSVEGHHLSLNFTVVDGKMLSITPSFFGANPAEVRQGPRQGLRVLGREEDLARALLVSLDDKQRKTALIAEKAPNDIATMAERKVSPLDPAGLSGRQMNAKQRQMLLGLLDEYFANMPPPIAEARMAKVKSAGLERLVFAWAGSDQRGQAHYYRVQGPSFLIEYDNTQNGANHVHSVWRDFEGDFGRDLLAEHYKNAPHHQGK